MKIKTGILSLIALVGMSLGMQQADLVAAHSSHHHHRHHKSHHYKKCGNKPSWSNNKTPDYIARADACDPVHLKSSLPWESVRDNVKTWRFLLINTDPVTFDTARLDEISEVIEKYISTYYFPSYRMKVRIDTLVPPSDEQLIANTLPVTTSRGWDVVEVNSAIPVYLVDEFSPDVENNFGYAFHGQVNDSVMNGIHPLFYLNSGASLFAKYNLLGPGMPFVIIPRGSVGPDGTNNGIVAEMSQNTAAGFGPTNFYDALAYTMAYEMIEVMGNPTGLAYILSGNTLEELGAGANPKETCYLKSLCAPFSSGQDNIRNYKGYSMPNFALPCYFFPYADEITQGCAVYDSMGNGRAPFTPYKGTQFVMYQESPDGVLSDLLAGTYTSTTTDPRNLIFTSYGSIYTWEGWGYELAQNNANAPGFTASIPQGEAVCSEISRGRRTPLRQAEFTNASTQKASPKIKLKAKANGLFPGRNHTLATVKAVAKMDTSVKVRSSKYSKLDHKVSFDPKKPQLLPFQYINHEGWLTQRYAVVNYSHRLDTPSLIAATQSVVDETRKLFLPYWNIMAEAAIYNVSSATTRQEALALLPKFDGTFIPFIINVPEQYRTDTAAAGFLGGGASNICNVPDVLAGPPVDFYLKDTPIFPVPVMPRGNPLVICSDLNFKGKCLVTTDQPGLGPFTMGAASFEPSNLTFPITAQAVINPYGDLTMCTTPPDNTPFTGKILVFTNNPTCATGGPQRYTNVNNSGCIASISVPKASSTYGFPSNLGLPYVTEPSQFMVGTSTPEGNDIVAAIQSNPNLQITINAPQFPIWNSVVVLAEILSHEFHELAGDPNYATYIATSNPPTDGTIVFSQYEAGDPVESSGGPASVNAEGQFFKQEAFPTPAYFIPNLKYEAYDDRGWCPKPLMPFARQQTAVHQAPIDGVNQPISPMQLLSSETSVPGSVWSQSSFVGLNIFDPTNYFEPLNNDVLFPADIDFHEMPFFSIYHKLLTNDHVLAYDYIEVLGPNSDQEF